MLLSESNARKRTLFVYGPCLWNELTILEEQCNLHLFCVFFHYFNNLYVTKIVCFRYYLKQTLWERHITFPATGKVCMTSHVWRLHACLKATCRRYLRIPGITSRSTAWTLCKTGTTKCRNPLTNSRIREVVGAMHGVCKDSGKYAWTTHSTACQLRTLCSRIAWTVRNWCANRTQTPLHATQRTTEMARLATTHYVPLREQKSCTCKCCLMYTS